ncbi:tyrosine-type recombinase/integrase [Rhodoblastus acidophilus]|uniref:Tyrosine-type recombinase/integrase n=1 Tax=Rhodoblastus acidophilus TaxID=1074 RepID=A0A6N8DRV3_RHOAC|nr:tyrosine-type recombinase/integrase [Rhodoblastus acidophilus]
MARLDRAGFPLRLATARADNDPTFAVRGALTTPTTKHRPAITDPAQLGAFLRALDGYEARGATLAAMRLLPLVFTRPGELRMAEWAEFDLANAVWTIPANRTKMRREHQVPLSRQALATLSELHAMTGDGRLVFPGLRTADSPISENIMNAALRRLGYARRRRARPVRSCAHSAGATAKAGSAPRAPRNRAMTFSQRARIAAGATKSRNWASRAAQARSTKKASPALSMKRNGVIASAIRASILCLSRAMSHMGASFNY